MSVNLGKNDPESHQLQSNAIEFGISAYLLDCLDFIKSISEKKSSNESGTVVDIFSFLITGILLQSQTLKYPNTLANSCKMAGFLKYL